MNRLNNFEKSIVKTLCYSDIFEYPLTMGEIYKYYLGRRASEEKIYSNILTLIKKGLINRTGDYVYLAGRTKLSKLRKRRLKISTAKWMYAARAISLLSKIPTVQLIGVSGSLSMDNAKKSDDIDMFFITKAGTLWITRFFVNLTLVANGVKRGKNGFSAANKICPNMFVSEDNMTMDRNLFCAHEIVQMKVLVNKNNTYEKFIASNGWVKEYMPNSFEVRRQRREGKRKGSVSKVMGLLDRAFYLAQYIYMKKSITTEKITPNLAKFHPRDMTNFIQILHAQRYQFYMKSFGKNGDFQPQISDFSRSRVTPGY